MRCLKDRLGMPDLAYSSVAEHLICHLTARLKAQFMIDEGENGFARYRISL